MTELEKQTLAISEEYAGRLSKVKELAASSISDFKAKIIETMAGATPEQKAEYSAKMANTESLLGAAATALGSNDSEAIMNIGKRLTEQNGNSSTT